MAPVSADTPGTVPVCPHESLTSARLAVITNLPHFEPTSSETAKKIDALTSAPDNHLRSSLEIEAGKTANLNMQCQPFGRPGIDATLAIVGTGVIGYRWNAPDQPDEPHNRGRSAPGKPYVALSMAWSFFVCTNSSPSIDYLRKELEKADVRFCAHKRLGDQEFLDAIVEVISPDAKLRDPIIRYQKAEEGYGCTSSSFPFPRIEIPWWLRCLKGFVQVHLIRLAAPCLFCSSDRSAVIG